MNKSVEQAQIIEMERRGICVCSQSECSRLGQRGAQRAQGLSVIELQPPMCSSGHCLSATAIMLRQHVACSLLSTSL